MSGMTSLVQAAGVIEHKMETVANNLANVNTVGFKEDQPSFREVLSTVQRVVPESLDERFLIKSSRVMFNYYLYFSSKHSLA